MAEIVFWSVLVVHVAYSLAVNRWDHGDNPKSKTRLIHVTLQGPLLWSAAFIGWDMGVFSRDLVSPVYIGLGLAAGHLVFGLSILATHLSWRDAWAHFFDFGPIWNFSMDSPSVLTRFIGVAFAEELIWRVVAQTFAIDMLARVLPQPQAVAIGIAVVALAFVVIHKHFFENTWYVSLEFVAFSVVIGAIYFWTQSFITVIVIHALRDIEIAYLEYLEKVDELGDEAQAAQAIDQAYRAQRLEKT
ncbi:MAG: CPBP family intramembrane metalloprotease [Candidatus Hydrogenedentes bacterium]|nr:CPBP family intramembrane metalloprotease [Candidatus Hydrogenedentota bacterium]